MSLTTPPPPLPSPLPSPDPSPQHADEKIGGKNKEYWQYKSLYLLYSALLYLQVGTRAVIGQFSGPGVLSRTAR